jgi:hypothetical protein
MHKKIMVVVLHGFYQKENSEKGMGKREREIREGKREIITKRKR